LGTALVAVLLAIAIIRPIIRSTPIETENPQSVSFTLSSIALLGLWAVPVIGLLVTGIFRVGTRSRVGGGWLAIGIAIVLSVIWFLVRP
jgi:hypothetical protein